MEIKNTKDRILENINNDITDSFGEAVKKRLTTSIYGTFLMSWLVFHGKLVITIFFVSEEKIWESFGIFKSDYLAILFFDPKSLYSYIAMILPFLLTWFIVWKLPNLLLLPAFEKEEEYRIGKKKIRIAKEAEIITKKTVLIEQSTKELKAVEKKKKQEKVITKLVPTTQWEREYQKLKKTKLALQHQRLTIQQIFYPSSFHYDHLLLTNFEKKKFKLSSILQ